MLTSLHIRNVVLIDQLDLELGTGLLALTGETGAGKSILLDSLGLALGARAESSLVRHGCDQASVTAMFDVPAEHPVFDVMREQGLEPLSPVICRRILGADGRSRAFINDEAVSITFLKMCGDMLVDIHGQFETYGLLNPALHLDVLDEYAGLGEARAHLAQLYRNFREAQKDFEDERAKAARAAEHEDFLRRAVEDLEKLDPQEGEETELLDLRRSFQNRAAILEGLSAAQESLGGEQGADMLIGQTVRALLRLADKVEGLDALHESLNQASIHVQEACRAVDDKLYALQSGGHSLEDIEDRLYALRAAARKYGVSAVELAGLRQNYAAQIISLDHQSSRLAVLEKEIEKARKIYLGKAQELHEARIAAAKQLDVAVNKELAPLKLDKATFTTQVDLRASEDDWSDKGISRVQFLVRTNAGGDAGPLNKIASGGEMARFMLALKLVLAGASRFTRSYVFDEIDTGIGGATASAVGERLARLALHHQVMVVTHSPQVASKARHHLVVSKASGKTHVERLDDYARREEIARMLSGSEITDEARAASAKLLEALT